MSVKRTAVWLFSIWSMIASKVIIHRHRWKMHIYECSNYTYDVDFTLHSHLNHLADAFTQSDSEKVHRRSTDGEHVIWNEVLPV